MPTPTELPLATLNRDIAQLETDAARLEIERRAAARNVKKASRRFRYLRFLKWFRGHRTRFDKWTLAVFVVGPLVIGLLAFLIVNFLSTSGPLALLALLVGAVAGAAMCALVLYRPNDAVLATALPEAEAALHIARARLGDGMAQLTDVSQRLEPLLAERRGHASADKLQRAMLLQRNWKNMRGNEWEDYVVEVCRTLGAHVQRFQQTGQVPRDQMPVTQRRATLPPVNHFIVTQSPRRVAVAAISDVRPFHPAAVRQAIDELAQHGCDTSAIIANTPLTAGSKELATSRRCTIIGEDDFPDFVLGKVSL